jgi:predicted MPP superfamily phosphohydrolase
VVATSTYALLTTLVLVVAALGLLVRAGRERRLDLVRTVGVVGVVFGVGALVQVVGQLVLTSYVSVFDLLSPLYYDLVIGLPLVGAGVLVLALLGRFEVGEVSITTPVAVGAVGSLLLLAVGFYATHVEPNRLELDEASLDLPADRSGDGPIRIGVISDIQTIGIGAHEHDAVDTLMAQDPDVVLVAGDLFQGSTSQYEANVPALRGLLDQMAEAPGGAFVVDGDTDDGLALRALVEPTDATFLEDEVAETRVGDQDVIVGGLALEATPTTQDVLGRLADAPEGTVRLLLAHRPEHVHDVDAGTVDLFAAGHTHGGQVAVPFIGPLMTLSPVPRDVAAGGLHEVGGTPIYVTTGVGREQQGAPQIRFLVPPSVGIVTLEA